MRRIRNALSILLVWLLAWTSPQPAQAYGLSTHLLLVDLLWKSSIVPLLCKSFPHQNYEAARAFAYSGAVVQDAGYYLYHGDRTSAARIEEFSDLTHYARSGDFITNLFKSATDVYELAFALGALTHYVGDIEGHSMATNRAVPVSFREKFPGFSVVTYEQQPDYHRRVEFGFDVNAAKLERLRPPSLMRGQRPNLSLQQLTYAYYRTYGLRQDLSWTGDGFSAKSFYTSANYLLPFGTYSRANAEKFVRVWETPDTGLESLISSVALAEGWREKAHHAGLPGPLARVVLHFISQSKIKPPEPETQLMYAQSVVKSVAKLRAIIGSIDASDGFKPHWFMDDSSEAAGDLPNVNLDTGADEALGTYFLSDIVHQVWLHQLAATSEEPPAWPVPRSAKDALGAFFSTQSLPNFDTSKLQSELTEVRKLPDAQGCPHDGTAFGSQFGWRFKNPERFKDEDPSRPRLCSYPY